jgi:hypothetical protein
MAGCWDSGPKSVASIEEITTVVLLRLDEVIAGIP